MIKNNEELEATLDRIRYFQQQVVQMRRTDTNQNNYKLSACGFLAEIDKMNLEIREYLSLHPSEINNPAA